MHLKLLQVWFIASGWCSITCKWQHLVLKPFLNLRNDRRESLGRRSNFRTAFSQMNTIWQTVCHAVEYTSQMCKEMIYLETFPNSKPDLAPWLSHSRNKADAQRSSLTLWGQQALLSTAIWKTSSLKCFMHSHMLPDLTQEIVGQLVNSQIKSTDR